LLPARDIHVGPYILDRQLGTGAFGVVWLAVHKETGEQVAVKVLHPHELSSAEICERFRREALMLSRLRSPHIAQMREFISESPLGMALVMEYVDGENLDVILKRRHFSVEEGWSLGVDALRATVVMHQNGIIHRDLKPENVIMRPHPAGGESAVIFDFNLSRLANVGGKPSSLTNMNSAIGTVPFMAPEQLLDARRVSEKADVYSIGAILFRAVMGRPPFEASSNFNAKLTSEPPPVSTGRSDALSVGFEAVVNRALRRRPQERFQTAQEMLDALLALGRPASLPSR